MTRRSTALLLAALLFAAVELGGCRAAAPAPVARPIPAEQPVILLPLEGPVTAAAAEISGLDWHGDQLVLLPQYPRRFADSADAEGVLFSISKAAILNALDRAPSDSSTLPLRPERIAFSAPGLRKRTRTFQGFEAIAFAGNRVFVAIESAAEAPSTVPMHGYVVDGAIRPNTARPGSLALVLDTAVTQDLPMQSQLGNVAYESLFVSGDTLVALYETNGRLVNPHPEARLFDLALRPLGTCPFPTVEYRITDVTTLDAERRFWAINYFFPGDRATLRPAPDSLALRYGLGATHQRFDTVERLVEFQYTRAGIRRTSTPPILLRLLDDTPRNWEGIVRLDDRGFLLVTDEYPGTLLAFVPHPGAAEAPDLPSAQRPPRRSDQ